MSIGLAAFLVLVEYLYLKTGDELYERIYKFLSLIFALRFGMGVVSGLVMSFEWRRGSDILVKTRSRPPYPLGVRTLWKRCGHHVRETGNVLRDEVGATGLASR
jgi:hypothetical protein